MSNAQATKPTKREQRAFLKAEIGRGQQIITGAEFRFGFGEITREELNAARAEGNALIVCAMDDLEFLATR